MIVWYTLGGIVCLGLAYWLGDYQARRYYRTKVPPTRKRNLEFLLWGRISAFEPHEQVLSQLSPLRYSESAFCGWSLNPDFLNTHGKRIHNRAGFRGDLGFEELQSDDVVVYCAGSSTTYCTDIEENAKTWTVLLEEKLRAEVNPRIRVINGGVGGYNTLQSFIRYACHWERLKPKLTLYYEAKNDLTVFYNAELDEDEEVLPDLSNVMRAVSLREMRHPLKRWKSWGMLGKVIAAGEMTRHQENILAFTYQQPPEKNFDLRQRLESVLDKGLIDGLRRNFVDFVAAKGGGVLCLTQRVVDPVLDDYIKDENRRIMQLADEARGIYTHDFDKAFSRGEGLLTDKLHFSEEGCRAVADYLFGLLAGDERLRGRLT